MAVIQAQGGGAVTSTSTDNNGSAIAGLRADQDNAKNVTLARTQPTIAGSRVTANLTAVTSSVSATVPFENDRGVILQVNDTVAGNATSPAGFLRFAGQAAQDSTLHKIESITITDRTDSIRRGEWNAFSGQFIPAHTGTHPNITMTLGTDSGVLTSGPTYQFGGATPLQDDYEAKTT